MNRKMLYLLLPVLTLALPACRTARLVNPAPIAAATSQAATHEAILVAMKRQDWVATTDAPGVVHAERNISNKHHMWVAISYDDSSVSLEYQNSRNLRYERFESGREVIHRNYLVWIRQLMWSIRTEIATSRRDSKPPA